MEDELHTMLILLAIGLASFVQGATGFGFGIVATALLALFADVTQAPALMLFGALTQNVTIFWNLRGYFTWESITPAVVGAVVGAPVGVYYLARTDPDIIVFTLGCLLIFTAARGFACAAKPRPWPGFLGLPTGLFAGVLHGAFGAGAPAAVPYMRSQGFHRFRYVATLQMVLGTSTLARGVALGGFGLVDRELLMLSLFGVAAALGGVRLGLIVLRVSSERLLGRITNLMLLGTGLYFVVPAAVALFF